jgi:hypothetical protein
MSNALAKYMTNADLAVPDEDHLANALTDSVEDTGGSRGDTEFLSFSGKKGEYALGRNNAAINPDTLYLLEPLSFCEGWICWTTSRSSTPAGRHVWEVIQRKTKAIAEQDLEDHGPYNEKAGDGWFKLKGFGFITLNPEAPKQAVFTNNSVSGLNSINDLQQEVADRIRAKEPHIPLFSFDMVEFEAQGQKNFKPLFPVELWISRAAAQAFFAGKLSFSGLLAGKEPRKRAARKKRVTVMP